MLINFLCDNSKSATASASTFPLDFPAHIYSLSTILLLAAAADPVEAGVGLSSIWTDVCSRLTRLI